MTWIGWLLIGAVLGWLASMLLDWNWWGDRRYCSDEELRLRSEVDELEGRVTAFKKERAAQSKGRSKLSKSLLSKKAPKSTKGGVAAVTGAAALSAAAAAKVIAKGDSFQKIWGVGPAAEVVLKQNDITTYEQLSQSNTSDLRTMLDDSGGTFNLVREDSWPEQAGLAAAGRWDKLDDMHETLSTEYVTREFTGEYHGKKDKLTKIWGIGQAVQRVLFNKGIFRFDQLAGTPLPMLQGIIKAAGDNFAYVQPELWIPQAELAAAGEMKELAVLKKKINSEHG